MYKQFCKYQKLRWNKQCESYNFMSPTSHLPRHGPRMPNTYSNNRFNLHVAWRKLHVYLHGLNSSMWKWLKTLRKIIHRYIYIYIYIIYVYLWIVHNISSHSSCHGTIRRSIIRIIHPPQYCTICINNKHYQKTKYDKTTANPWIINNSMIPKYWPSKFRKRFVD